MILHFNFSFAVLKQSVLAFDTQVRRFAAGRSHRIFKGEKILSMPSFRGGEVSRRSHVVPLRHVKKSINVTWKLEFRQNLPDISRPRRVPPSATGCCRVVTPGGVKLERLTQIAQ
jgi:hypothetical protein